MTEPHPSQPTHCYRHSGVPATIRCQRCGRPICTHCMREASVGYQCPDCVAGGAVRQLQGPYGGRLAADPKTTTLVLAVINLLVWAAIFLTGGGRSRLVPLLALRRYGGCLDTGTFYTNISAAACRGAGGQWLPGAFDGGWWQPLTSAFTHIEFWHILGNLITLWFIGPQLEGLLGRARFLMLYVGSALAGSALVVWLAGPATMTLGASGAIFGLLGGLLLVARERGGDWTGVLKWIGLNLVITVVGMSFISWQGHVGGLLGGAALAAVIVYAPRGPHRARTQWLGMSLIVALCVALIVARAFVR